MNPRRTATFRAPVLAECASTEPTTPDPARRTRRRCRLFARPLLATAAAVAAVAAMTVPAAPATAAGGTVCQSVTVPVTAGLIVGAHVHGVLCTPPNPNGDLQVLVSGATYDWWYFNGEGVAASSYMAAANQAGTTTLAIDPLGTGQSTRPLSTLLTGAEQASAIHQVIQAARAGRLDGVLHQRVILVGHSMGSMDTILTADAYPDDVDGVVLTGFTHLLSATNVAAAFLGPLRPAFLEGFSRVDPGYLTTVPGSRLTLFGSPGNEDPAVAAGDEAHRDVLSTVEIGDTLALSLLPTSSLAIRVPVLLVDGSADTLFCGPLTLGCNTSTDLYAHESGDFTRALATYVLAGSGHDVALAANAATADQVIQQWTASLRAGHVITGPMGG